MAIRRHKNQSLTRLLRKRNGIDRNIFLSIMLFTFFFINENAILLIKNIFKSIQNHTQKDGWMEQPRHRPETEIKIISRIYYSGKTTPRNHQAFWRKWLGHKIWPKPFKKIWLQATIVTNIYSFPWKKMPRPNTTYAI